MHVHEYVAEGSLPQETQTHTAQNQRGLPMEQLTVDLKTCREKRRKNLLTFSAMMQKSAKVNITYGRKIERATGQARVFH